MLTNFINTNFSNKLIRCTRIVLGIAGPVLVVDCGLLLCTGVFHIGIIMPLGIGIIFLVHSIYWQTIEGYLAEHYSLKKIWQIIWLLFFLWLLSFCVFVSYLKHHFNSDNHPTKAKAIIILGGGTKDNKPTVAVQSRLDKAYEEIKLFPNALIVTSGGFDKGEDVSEADAMAEYLHQHYGVDLSQIKLEEQSTSTELNFANSKKILEQYHIQLDEPMIAVTSDFHTLRSSLIAKKQGYSNLQMVGANTPWYIRPNIWFREYFAFISGWILNEY